MAKIPTNQATEFQLRPGVEPLTDAGWRGVNTEDDPISLAPNELQRGQNLRRQGKSLRSRPGLVEKIDLADVAQYPPGSVMWMKEAPVVGSPLNLWASCGGVAGDLQTGATILQLESTAVPVSRPYATITADADRQIPLAVYGSKLLMGDGNVLRELIRVLVFPGADVDFRIPTAPTTALAQIPGFMIRCLLEFDGKLFVGLENLTTPASSKIMVWDGLQLKDDLTGIRPPLAFGIWRDKLVAGFDATAGHIRTRIRGVAPGSWTTVALAGFFCATQGNAMQEVGPYLYIASGEDLIFRYDGAALSLIHTIAGCATDGTGVTSLTLHNGILYYGWNEDTTHHAHLGRHDPDSTATEWIDDYKDLTTEQPNFNNVSALASYRNQIYCGGSTFLAPQIVATSPDYVKGDLETIAPVYQSADIAFPDSYVLQFLRF